MAAQQPIETPGAQRRPDVRLAVFHLDGDVRKPRVRGELANGSSCCEAGHRTAEAAVLCLSRALGEEHRTSPSPAPIAMAKPTRRPDRRQKAPTASLIREEQRGAAGQPLTEDTERYSRPEPAPYHGWCGACGGWYFRGAETRWHFGADGSAGREHIRCEPASPTRPAPIAERRHLVAARQSRPPPPKEVAMASVTERLEARRQAIREGEAILGLEEPRSARLYRGLMRTWELDQPPRRRHSRPEPDRARQVLEPHV